MKIPKRQYPSFEEAITYLEQRGKLEYFGHSGINHEYAVYTLTIGRIVYHLSVYDSGKVVVTDQRYV